MSLSKLLNFMDQSAGLQPWIQPGDAPQQAAPQQANPAQAWLARKYPQLFANGEQLPQPPAGWQQPPIELSAVQSDPMAGYGAAAPANAPVTAPSAPQQAAAVPAAAPAKHHGLLGALANIIAPQPGSFLWSAMNNGLTNARQGQADYAESEAEKQIQLATLSQKLKQLQTKGEYQVVGNNVFHIRPDGTTEMISAAAQPTETQRLIDQWRTTPPGPERDLIERAIKGYQYTPNVIGATQQARAAAEARLINLRGSQARQTKAAPAAPSNRAAGPPPGFILN